MKRRLLLQCGGTLFAWPALLLAQTQRRVRVGWLSPGNEASVKPLEEAFLSGMHELGYTVGRNLVVDMRFAHGEYDRLSRLAEELVALKPDVLMGIETLAIVLRSKTKTIPIVMTASVDPVAAGLVQSLARPSTNVTGMAYRQDELVAKHIDFLSEIVPNMSRVGLLNYAAPANDPAANVTARYEQSAKKAAAGKGLALLVAGVRAQEDVQRAFAKLEKERSEALVVASTGVTYHLRNEIAAHARRLRLPTISALPGGWVEAGGMLNYGPDFRKNYRYAAAYVDRIVKGANPAHMPIEQPAFELVVNLIVAREIGVTIPRSILLRADRIID